MNSNLPPTSGNNFELVKSQARGRWADILAATGIDREYLRNHHGPCPACGGKDRFRFDDKDENGTFYCNQCGAGDGFKLAQLKTGKSGRDLLALVASILRLDASNNLPRVSPSPSASGPDLPLDQRKLHAIMRVLAAAIPVQQGDPVWHYLNGTRGLKLAVIPDTLKYHDGLEYWTYVDGKRRCVGTFPAMVAPVSSSTGNLVGCHRTFLTNEGRKAPVPEAKKLMQSPRSGITIGGAVRLYEASDVLGVGEGIETALACHRATGLPVWSAISDGGMAKLQVPGTVRELIIFADRDDNGAGQEAARKLSCRMHAEGKRVKWLQPGKTEIDFADIWKEFPNE